MAFGLVSERVRPHERFFRPTTRVPGAPDRSETMFDLAQALSWVASHRNDFQERLAWRGQIQSLSAGLDGGGERESRNE